MMRVVGGSASVTLARGIARELDASYVDVAFEKHPGGFPDGERYVRLTASVAGDKISGNVSASGVGSWPFSGIRG